jgi:hypothetical protein
MTKPPGIKQRMAHAASRDELQSLVSEVRGYKWASKKTLNKCQRIVNQKLKEMPTGRMATLWRAA